jgi:hypothetical protein
MFLGAARAIEQLHSRQWIAALPSTALPNKIEFWGQGLRFPKGFKYGLERKISEQTPKVCLEVGCQNLQKGCIGALLAIFATEITGQDRTGQAPR